MCLIECQNSRVLHQLAVITLNTHDDRLTECTACDPAVKFGTKEPIVVRTEHVLRGNVFQLS